MIRWMIDEGHLDEDDDPTIGLRSGKAKASRESGGFVPWTEDDMATYRAKWPLGTEARLMFDILHYTFLRLGDAHRFGPPHLRQVVRKMAVQIATEKSRGNTTVTVPVHPQFAESLPDDGDVRLDRPEDAGALHRQGEPGKARDERHGEDRGVRSKPIARRTDGAARRKQGRNAKREQSSNFA